MESSYFICLFITSLATAITTYLVIQGPLRVILNGLVEPAIAAAFAFTIYCGVFVIAMIAGVGHLDRISAGGADNVWPPVPDGGIEWFFLICNTAESALIGICSLLGIVFFSCLVFHVALVRAKLTGREAERR